MLIRTFIFMPLLAGLIRVQAAPEQNDASSSSTNNSKQPGTECLPIDEELQNYQCIPSLTYPIDCIDTHDNCEDWAKRGECQKNPQYMLIGCRHSCESCIDIHSLGVPQIATKDEERSAIYKHLVETQDFMHRQAEHSVKLLTKCVNKHAECTAWAHRGECTTNAGFMLSECGPACRNCDAYR